MQSSDSFFPLTAYHLTVLQGIAFTSREIDILACLLYTRSTSKMAHILTLSPNTVIVHVRNIMKKLECNSRESVVDFIEKSQSVLLLNQHYIFLRLQAAFEASLKEIAKLNKDGGTAPTALRIHGENKDQQVLVANLKAHLKQVGLQVDIRQEDESGESSLVVTLLGYVAPSVSSDPIVIDLRNQKNYYLSVFAILEKVLPTLDLGNVVSDFEKAYTERASQKFSHEPVHHGEIKSRRIEDMIRLILEKTPLRKKMGYGAFGLLLVLVGIGLLWQAPKQSFFPVMKESSVRSDMVLPTESALLHRPESLAQIANKFKEKSGIQTVAVVGIGGAGKTTLARQYATQQRSSIIWEINAETPESLRSSFEKLSQTLAKKEEDQNTLRRIHDIKDPGEREEKLVQFVKERLRLYSDWFLIYDNVEKFTDIQKYFPQDFMTWGRGKVLITTRDDNIQNNKYVNHVVHIGELTPSQKLTLFSKIMNQEEIVAFTSTQTVEAEAFLEEIPPFPLDVSIAAYYLKATHVSYPTYVESLFQNNEDFENVQEDLSKESGDYNKTRYGIIALSLQHVIDAHKDFKDLLLFISLLDSQDIPRSLLDEYKNNATVDSFIHSLRKYSLITNGSTHAFSTASTFSLHRSTQQTSLTYLKRILALEKNKLLISPIVHILEERITSVGDEGDFATMKLFLNHCNAFLMHKDLLTDTATGAIESKLGGIYLYLGHYEKARQFLEEGLANLRKNNEENQLQIAWALARLGNVYKGQDNYEKAKNLLEESLLIYTKHSLEHHADIPYILTHLGSVHRHKGDPESAKSFLEKSLALYRQHFPDNQAGIARTLVNLGNTHRKLGEYEKAKTLLEQSIAIYKTHFSDNHAEMAQAFVHLGSAHRSLGEYEKAQTLYEQSLAVYKKHFPENHFRVLWVSGYLSTIHNSLGNYEDAKILLEKNLSFFRQYHPENHIEIAWTLVYLGIVNRELGHYEKAKALIEEGSAIYREILGDDHIRTSWARAHQGIICHKFDDHVRAKAIVEESLAFHKQHYEDDHPSIAWLSGHLAHVHKELGQHEDAKALLEYSRANYEKRYGKSHIETAKVMRGLGEVYFLEGKMDMAENLLQQSLAIFQKSEHSDSYKSLEALAELHLKKATLLEEKGETAAARTAQKEARDALAQALNVVKTSFPEDSPHIERVQSQLNTIK